MLLMLLLTVTNKRLKEGRNHVNEAESFAVSNQCKDLVEKPFSFA